MKIPKRHLQRTPEDFPRDPVGRGAHIPAPVAPIRVPETGLSSITSDGYEGTEQPRSFLARRGMLPSEPTPNGVGPSGTNESNNKKLDVTTVGTVYTVQEMRTVAMFESLPTHLTQDVDRLVIAGSDMDLGTYDPQDRPGDLLGFAATIDGVRTVGISLEASPEVVRDTLIEEVVGSFADSSVRDSDGQIDEREIAGQRTALSADLQDLAETSPSEIQQIQDRYVGPDSRYGFTAEEFDAVVNNRDGGPGAQRLANEIEQDVYRDIVTGGVAPNSSPANHVRPEDFRRVGYRFESAAARALIRRDALAQQRSDVPPPASEGGRPSRPQSDPFAGLGGTDSGARSGGDMDRDGVPDLIDRDSGNQRPGELTNTSPSGFPDADGDNIPDLIDVDNGSGTGPSAPVTTRVTHEPDSDYDQDRSGPGTQRGETRDDESWSSSPF